MARVAILDDDLEFLTSLTEACHLLGVEFVTFSSAESLWISNRLDTIDVFLIDVHLPGIDGVTLVSSVSRRVEIKRTARFVAMSGKNVPAGEWLRAGFDSFLNKPISLDMLHRALRDP